MTPDLNRRTALGATGAVALAGLTAENVAAADRHAGVKTGLFEVRIDDVEVQGWQEVKIPARRTEERNGNASGESPEAGGGRGSDRAEYEKKTWGQPSFDDLEMERGVKPGETKFHDWYEAIKRGDVEEGRKEITIKMLDGEGRPSIEWDFSGAWLKEYQLQFYGSADGQMATESIMVAYDKMERKEV